MSNNILNTRIQHKHDVEANWVKAKNFIPLVGEIIVYDRDDNFSYERFKIGDGVTNVNELGFVNQADWGAERYQPGHILNRTHWDEITFTKEILAKQRGIFYGDIYHFNQSTPYDIENGKEYCVTYNGQQYFVSFVGPIFPLGFDYYGICTTEEFDMIYLYDNSEADGLRYALWLQPKTEISDVVLSIHEYNRVIHKLPSEYLDDSIPHAEKKWIMEEQDGAQGVDETFGNVWYINTLCVLNAGEEYTIVYNGEEYDCVAQPVNIPGAGIPEGAMGLGNWVLAGGEDTGEPFALVATPSNGFVTVKDFSNAESVRVGLAKTTVQKIDRRSLPDGVPYIESARKVILPETVFTGLSSDGVQIDTLITLLADKTYFVNWNGTEYTCKGIAVSDTVVTIGNCGFISANNNEPFGIAHVTDDNDQTICVIFSQDGSTEATVSIEIDSSVIHKIDARCLPEIPEPITYSLSKSGSDIKLIGSDGSETSVIDSDTNSLKDLGVIASATELNYLDGVTSSVQTQLNNKPGKIVTNQSFIIDGSSVNAKTGAEIFNNYSTNKAIGMYSHAEGANTTASGEISHAEGVNTVASGYSSHAEGNSAIASGIVSHAEGFYTIASNAYSHAEGDNTVASNYGSHAEGSYTIASGSNSHAEGDGAIASGWASHAEGTSCVEKNQLTGEAGVTIYKVEGSLYTGLVGTRAKVYGSDFVTVVSIDTNNETVEFDKTLSSDKALSSETCAYYRGEASGDYSHAEGKWTTASGLVSHAEGVNTVASGYSSHAEGNSAIASGIYSHAEGDSTVASGEHSHAEGDSTVATGSNSHAQGKWNVEDVNKQYAHIVGNGTALKRSNAHTLDWDGNAWFAGDVYVGSTSGINKDEGSKKLATEEYVEKKTSPNNLLNNTDFKNPVNNRGQSSYKGEEGEVDCIDKWSISSVAWMLTVGNRYITVSGNPDSTSTTAGMFRQFPVLDENLVNKTVTFAAKVKGKNVRLNINNQKTSSYNTNESDWKILTVTGTITSTKGFYVALQSTNPDTTSYKCEWVALYEGEYTADNLPEYKAKGHNLEALNCGGLEEGTLLMYNREGKLVTISKADLIAEIIAALPSAEEASF